MPGPAREARDSGRHRDDTEGHLPRLNGRPYPVREDRGPLHLRAGKDGEEFLAAEPSGDATPACRFPKHLREHLERLVPRLVPMLVVESLEVVHVEEDDGEFDGAAYDRDYPERLKKTIY